MKKLTIFKRFRSIVILAMGLMLYLNNAKAQNSITVGAPTSLIDGFTITVSIKVTKGDTVVQGYDYASDTSFAGATGLPNRRVTRDTIIRDTFTVKKNQLPPTDTTGYTLWLRPTKIFVKAHDTGFLKPYQSVIVYPKPGIIKVYNFAITPTSYGGVVSFFGRAGSQYETVNLTYSYNYPTDTIWRTPNPKNGKFTGNTSFYQNITGILSNRKIKFRVYMQSSVDTFNTVVTFTTTPTSTKPVVAEGSGKSATADSAFLNVEATSFNLNSKFYVINTANNDTIVKNVTSPKMEILNYRIGKLTNNTKCTFKVYGINGMGISNVIYITITTQPKLVTPTFTALKPEIRWYDGQYSIIPKLDWTTNSGEKIKRIDMRVYTDSLKNNAPSVYKISDANAGLTGPLTGPRTNSDSGRFWYEFSIETTNNIYTSNLLGYNVGWALVPKSTLGVTELQKKINSIPCPIQDGNIQLGLQEESELTIFDGSGKPVIQNHMEAGNNNVDLSTLKGGNYYLIVSDKKGTATRKIQIR